MFYISHFLVNVKLLPCSVIVQSQLSDCSLSQQVSRVQVFHILTFFCLQLDFVAELPPLSLAVYHVTKAAVGSAHRAQYTFYRQGNPPTVQSEYFQVSRPKGPEADAPLSLSNKHVQMWSSPETGLLQVRLFKLKVTTDTN